MYVIADMHGDLNGIIKWIEGIEPSIRNRKEIILVLGDAGMNYRLDKSDYTLKETLQETIEKAVKKNVSIDILFVRGNHECRPENTGVYRSDFRYGDTVYVEDGFENLLFLKDGGIYTIDGEKYVVIGGGFSDDFFDRILNGYGIWTDQELSTEEFKSILNNPNLPEQFTVLSHVAPAGVSKKIKETEIVSATEMYLQLFLELYCNRIRRWILGHYHTESILDHKGVEFQIVYKDIQQLAKQQNQNS